MFVSCSFINSLMVILLKVTRCSHFRKLQSQWHRSDHWHIIRESGSGCKSDRAAKIPEAESVGGLILCGNKSRAQSGGYGPIKVQKTLPSISSSTIKTTLALPSKIKMRVILNRRLKFNFSGDLLCKYNKYYFFIMTV